ncbi:trypsin-like serine protease [Coniochaeta sp. PMI_546]|nr:trypsin-like serine protease [Coniochaeta sp. PMI_546]
MPPLLKDELASIHHRLANLEQICGSKDEDKWQAATDAAIQAVVTVVGMWPVPFDLDPPRTISATGFVVHVGPEIGIIATPRHVVGAGPFEGFCRFANNEEVNVSVPWRDPIHDCALLVFQVKDIKAAKPVPLRLRPDLAKVGMDIRIVGNDEGEELAVLPGVLSRIDANVPNYGRNIYNDFNTNYLQGSNDASGGSSGSPVIDIDGFAIAMIVGGSDKGATNMFLPLDKLQRALECLIEGKPITRGDIGCQFWIESLTKCEKLGLSDQWKETVQDACPWTNNMLVAKQVLPGGQSDGSIMEGDILVKIDDEFTVDFIRLDDVLDSNVGSTITLLLLRNGNEVEVEVEVGDLYKNTPDRYVLYAGSVFQNCSYQHARHHHMPCKGVVVCGDGSGSGIWDRCKWLIQKVNNKPVPDLDTFVDIVTNIPDNAFVRFAIEDLNSSPRIPSTMNMMIHRLWHPKILLVMQGKSGQWEQKVLCDRPADPEIPSPMKGSFPQLEIDDPAFSCVSNYTRSFVRVVCEMQVAVDGEANILRTGDGFVVDASLGLVLVSRHLIPHDFSCVYVIIAGSISLDAKILFHHPEHNFVLIRYDATLVDADVFSGVVSETEVRQGDEVYLLGPDGSAINRIVHEKTTVTKISPHYLDQEKSWSPAYCATNFDCIQVGTPLGSSCETGVLVNQSGEIVALWLQYRGQGVEDGHEQWWNRGFSLKTVEPVISQIRDGLKPSLRILGAHFWPTTKHNARSSGVSQHWMDKLESAPSASHQFLQVDTQTSFWNVGESNRLQVGDILLTINDRFVTSFSDLDHMYWKGQETPVALVVRDGVELSIALQTFAAEEVEIDHIVYVLGAVVQKPPHTVRRRLSNIPSDVYISSAVDGSPADLYGKTNVFITHVNDKSTPDLVSFVDAMTRIGPEEDFCVVVVGYDGETKVIPIRNHTYFHPLRQWRKDESCGGTWREVACDRE